jgi:hypothetical protein
MAGGGVYVRFVVGADGENHRQLTGILTEARLLRDAGLLSAGESQRLEHAYDWFNTHVPVPPFSTARWNGDVVSWFRANAGEAITRMWDVMAILRDHGVPTRMLRSRDPGKVVYDDDVQVVIEEWRHL